MAVPLLSFYKKKGAKFMSYVIGVDLGTQSLKGLLVDPEGQDRRRGYLRARSHISQSRLGRAAR